MCETTGTWMSEFISSGSSELPEAVTMAPWKAPLSSVMRSISGLTPSPVAASIRVTRSFMALMSASVTRVAARAAACPSSSARRSKMSPSSPAVQVRTRAPLLGRVASRPSDPSRRSASRTGVRLTPNESARSASPSRAPWAYVPSRIPCRSVS